MAENTADLTVEILRQIRDQLAKTDERVEKLGDRFETLGDRVETLGNRVETLGKNQIEANELIKVLVSSHNKLNEKTDATNERLDATNQRLDRLIAEIVKGRTHDAARLLDVDERLARIEKHLGLERH